MFYVLIIRKSGACGAWGIRRAGFGVVPVFVRGAGSRVFAIVAGACYVDMLACNGSFLSDTIAANTKRTAAYE